MPLLNWHIKVEKVISVSNSYWIHLLHEMGVIMKIKKIMSSILYILRNVWIIDKTYYLLYILQVIISSFQSIFTIIFTKDILNNLIESNYNSAFLFAIYLILTINISILMNKFLNVYMNNKLSRIALSLDKKILKKYYDLDYEILDKTEIINQFENAKKYFSESGVSVILNALSQVITALITISGMIYLISGLNVFVLLIIITALIINSFCEIKRMNYRYKNIIEETPLEMELTFIRSVVSDEYYAKEIRMFNLYNYITEKTTKLVNSFFKIHRKVAIQKIKLLWWTYLLSFIELVIVYFFVVQKYFSDQILLGDFSLNISSILQFSLSMRTLFFSLIKIYEKNIYIEDVRKFLNIENYCYGNETINIKNGFTFEFKNVSFKYPGSTDFAIRDINIQIKNDDQISIVGENGSGKTTFVKLLMRLYHPTDGEILLNNKNINEYKKEDYNHIFSTVFQDFLITAYSIKENISFSQEFNKGKMDECLEKINLKAKIKSLPLQEETYLSQKLSSDGTELSGGEEQKLVIARAMYKNGDVYILDEPTASLSPQSEYELYEKFASITSGKTVIYISHRLSSCRLTKKIFVFKDGRVIEQGTHENLLKQNGFYSKMFSLQAKYYKDIGEVDEKNGN